MPMASKNVGAGHRRARRYRKSITKAKRQRIYERDGFACVACGSTKELSIDHRVPITLGGTNEDSNLQTMCWTCNGEKGDRMPASEPLRAR